MSEAVPLRASTNPLYLFSEFQSGEVIGVSHGGFGGSSLAQLSATLGLTPPLSTSAYLFGGNGWVPTSSVSGTGTGGPGVTDHGALTGLTDNDHPQYVLSSVNAALSSLVTSIQTSTANLSAYIAANELDWVTATTDHGSLTGLTDNDHPQYVLSATNFGLSSTVSSLKVATINYIIDGGGVVITTGIKGDIVVDYACTIESATILGDQTGSIVVDIWKDTYANYPPTDADSITSATPPTITTNVKNQDTTLSSWIVSIAAGDILRFNVDSVTAITRATVSLKVRRT